MIPKGAPGVFRATSLCTRSLTFEFTANKVSSRLTPASDSVHSHDDTTLHIAENLICNSVVDMTAEIVKYSCTLKLDTDVKPNR